MDSINSLFLLVSLLLFVSVLTSTLSARMGMPLLLLFLIVGMLAGEDGPGGIGFNDFNRASLISNLALAIILLDGGLRTRMASLRVALWPATVLATWGVVVTSAVLGLFVTWLFDDWHMGMLLAAIVGSTDAAAVFTLLRDGGVRLNERVKSTLEIESGANDPMAILLVTVTVGMLTAPGQTGVASVVRMLASQMIIGGVLGFGGGVVLARLLLRLHLVEGLYALLIVSGGLMIFAATNLVGGSGFLAVYVAGLIAGNRRCHATEHVLQVMDGLAWLAQACMFLVLGLLVKPSHLLESAPEALAMATFLMLVARPFAIVVGLWPFRFPWREVTYISWVGLRGAVPIVLAIMPMVAGVPNSGMIFNVTFVVVLLSLVVQGATVPMAARWLKVEVPPQAEPIDRREVWVDDQAALDLVEFRVEVGSSSEARHPDDVAAECGGLAVRCVSLVRGGLIQTLRVDTRLVAGDLVWFVASEEPATRLAKLFAAGVGSELSAHAGFFGEFVVDPACPAGELASAYGFKLEAEEDALTLASLLRGRIGRRVVVGDRVSIGAFVLTVREVDDEGVVTGVGLKCPERFVLN
ncbi:K(+)/H(+) antiporter [Betaproteobacteria bacterium]|nr:K(+)/H(+) antiporter [Betaproteobacteria bacterium]